jgi:hypothetical protein
MKWVNEEVIVKSDLLVEEYINYYDGEEVFSIVKDDNLKIFLEKDEMNHNTNRFIVYDINNENAKIIFNNNIVFDNLKDKILVNTHLFTNQIESIEIKINDIVYDCTDNYKKIGRNKIVIE